MGMEYGEVLQDDQCTRVNEVGFLNLCVMWFGFYLYKSLHFKGQRYWEV